MNPNLLAILNRRKFNEFSGLCPSLSFHAHSTIADNQDTFTMPDKLLAISDIEGNFNKYFHLLVSNNVIDTNYNWIFGNGHLIINGDLVDRGNYVTQCLWLTYHLEDQAKQKGGKFHYLLGNHEQLNLLGYDNYCAPMYRRIYDKLQIDNSQFYSTNSILGSWLRNKNSMVKIGDLVFVHGGISPSILKYNLTIDKINSEIKRDIATQDFKSDESMALLTEEGILWYRGLIEKSDVYDKIAENELDKILISFKCKSILVGHTPVDRISKDFNRKVIRLDVDHYENSSALYIEKGIQYIIDDKGVRTKM